MTQWASAPSWTAMTIGLNGLATTASAISSTVIANDGSKDIFVDLSLMLGSIAPGTAPAVEFHLLPLLADGSTYADIVRADDVRPLTVATSTKAVMAQGLRISPGKYVVAIVNQAGVALASSGNALAYRTYSPA